MSRFADWLDRLHLVRILAALSNVGILIAVIAFWYDFTDRYDARTNQAWAVLSNSAPGNSGKVKALAYLNKEIRFLGFPMKKKQNLTGIDLSSDDNRAPVYLRGVQLPHADLTQARFIKANLIEANLQGANLTDADLSSADLHLAKLDGAEIHRVDLTGAYLDETSLVGAVLARSSLAGATLFLVDWRGAVVNEIDISGARLGWANKPSPMMPGIGLVAPRAFWAWADRLPSVLIKPDFPGVLGIPPPWSESRPSLQEIEEIIPNFVSCPAELRPEWEASGRPAGVPDGCH